MPKKRTPVEQRRNQIVAQVERLRRRLASKTRKDYSSDFHYEKWRTQTDVLIDELLAELSVLDDPGEYNQLPPAVVAEELGTTTANVRLLIKGGEILASGKPAHEYVSREEMAIACEAGMKELTQRMGQVAEEIFEESVDYLRHGQVRLAERACRRLIARETIAGIHALPYETALLLAKSQPDEIDARLRFIGRAEDSVRRRLLHNLNRVIRGVSFENEAMMVIAERLIYGYKSSAEVDHKVPSSKLDKRQQLAMFITIVILNEIGSQLRKSLRVDDKDKLCESIRDAVYSSLHAQESYDRLASSKKFVDVIRVSMPRYFKPAKLVSYLMNNPESNYDEG